MQIGNLRTGSPIAIVKNVPPDVPGSVDREQHNHSSEEQPQIFPSILFHLHKLVHAHYHVHGVDAERAE